MSWHFNRTAPWMQISTKFANIFTRDFEIILFSNNWLPMTNRKIGVFFNYFEKSNLCFYTNLSGISCTDDLNMDSESYSLTSFLWSSLKPYFDTSLTGGYQALKEHPDTIKITAQKVSIFGVTLVCIQSKCGKIRTRITPNTDTFYAVNGYFSNLEIWSAMFLKNFWKTN